MLYNITIYPVEIIYKSLYLFISGIIGSYGISLIALSIVTTILILPFMHWANGMQASEKHLQDVMLPQLKAIKQESTGAEQHKRITNLYRRYGYHPIMAVRSAAGVALQIPFLMAAYYMLSTLPNIQGQTFLLIKDLSKPDGLLWSVNLLPILMTVINIFSACTTKNFATKDKIQAAIIAFLFLLLLYDATSALLVFWTCNNLWILLGNLRKVLFERLSFTPKKIMINGQDISYWFTNIPYDFMAATALLLTFFIFIPINIYLNNVNEFWFTLSDIIYLLLAICLLSLFLLFVIMHYILTKKKVVFLVCLIFGITIGLCLQSYVINLDYGVLDGHQIDWTKYHKEALLNILIWFICILAPFFMIFLLKINRFKKIIKNASFMIIIIQLCSTVYLFSSNPIAQKTYTYFSTDKMFELSTKNNIIIFILDTFETEEFQRLISEHPELSKPLDGFTYFPDAVGSYPTTMGALPQILTGQWYKLQEPYKDYLKDAWNKNKFWQHLHDINYDCRIYPDIACAADTAKIENLVLGKIKISSYTGLLKDYLKLTAFRSFPHNLKHYFVLYTGEFDAVRANKIYHADDVNFYKQLCKNGVNTITNKNCFRFYHLQGPHGPWTMTRNIERTADGTFSTYDDQAIASLKIVGHYIEELKKDHLYDQTAMIIMADHGNHSGEAVVRSPLILIKEQYSKGKMKVSQNPVSHANLQATVLATIHDRTANSFGTPFMVKRPEYERKFLSYLWKIPWEKDYMPYLAEYHIFGKASNPNSWHNTGIVYDIPKDNTYKSGTEIYFNKGGKGDNYIANYIGGWSTPEDNFTWTDGPEAALKFRLNDLVHNNILLRILAFPYLGSKVKSQKIGVYINNIKITSWDISNENWYSVIIPANVIKTKDINIKFTISNPISPKNVGESEDDRKLGIAVKELIISNAD